MSDLTVILQAIRRGDGQSSQELLPLVYDELRHLAAAWMVREVSGHTLQATALVHEAWLRMVNEKERNWENRVHFFRAAAQAMRRILIDRARHRSSMKHGGGQERLNIDELELAAKPDDDRVLLINEALMRLEAEEPELARIVSLKFFGGLTNAEVAEINNVAERTVERQWAYAKASLFRTIRDEVSTFEALR